MSAEQNHTIQEWEALRQAMLTSNAKLPDPSPLVLQRALAQINARADLVPLASVPDGAPAESPALQATTPVAPATVPGNMPPGVAALQEADGWRRHRLAGLLLLIRCQIPLISQSIWAASAIVLAIGVIVGVIYQRAGGTASYLLTLAAPIVAAVGIALLYGPEHDPATELECATPISPALILLARLVLVYSYDLLLALATSVVLWLLVGHIALSALILSWLAPMLFLSALALVLSVLWNSQGAIVIAFSLWGMRVLLLTHPRVLDDFAGFSDALWSNQGLLLGLTALCMGLAFFRVTRQEQRYV